MRATGLDGGLDLLACPHCALAVHRVDEAVVGCVSGHRFDIARQGYVALLARGSRTDTGDSADMVAARLAFLAGGHYRSIAAAVAGFVETAPVLDIGAGTGYYLAAVLDRLAASAPASRPAGLALDASRYAARRAAADRRICSVVADAWSALPVRDGRVGTVLSIFAPRSPAEIDRVLGPSGRAVVVTPDAGHLAELRSTLALLAVDVGKPDRLAEAFAGRLRTLARAEVTAQMRLSRRDVDSLVRMGPSRHHLRSEQIEHAVRALDEVTAVTLAVTVSVLEKGTTGPPP